MPKVSKATASNVTDFGAAVDHAEHLDDYTVDFVSIRETHSLAPLLKGLPGDACQCPHWGYLFAGTLTVSYNDRPPETYHAGDAFYMSPGHVPSRSRQRTRPVHAPETQPARPRPPRWPTLSEWQTPPDRSGHYSRSREIRPPTEHARTP